MMMGESSLLYCGHCQLSKQALIQDIRSLILRYLKLNTCSLGTFKELWQDFKYIQFACTDEKSHHRKLFIEYVYAQVLQYLLLSSSIQGKVCVIYTLHFLYLSQFMRPLWPIPVTEETLLEIMELYRSLCTEELTEPAFVLHKMLTQSFFILSAS